MTTQDENTIGLVVCGGKSSRMGSDKSMLIYHNEPQAYHLFHLLKQHFTHVYLSCNKQQAINFDRSYPTITDEEIYSDIGPMAALLSTWTSFPGKSILVVGCDYPFIAAKDLLKLHSSFTKNKFTNAYFNEDQNIYEPLLACYSCDCYPDLLSQFQAGNYSLQFFLKRINAQKIAPQDAGTIQSIDTPEAYEKAKNLLKLKSNSKPASEQERH